MSGFIEGVSRDQAVLFPERLDDWIGEDHLVRVGDLLVDRLDLVELGFPRHAAARTGRPGYHPAVRLKLVSYGYLNRVPCCRRLECEAGRNVELMWLTGRPVPDRKTIADFRRQNGPTIRKTCAKFVDLCRRVDVLRGEVVAVDGEPGSRLSRTVIGTTPKARSRAAWPIWKPRLVAISRKRTGSIVRKLAMHAPNVPPI